jgi:hypothetical protein
MTPLPKFVLITSQFPLMTPPPRCRIPSLSTRTHLQTPTRWLVSFPCMLPHYPSVQRNVSHDNFVHLRAALIHTAHLPYCLATAISTTQTLEDRMAVRHM